jgi:hypothetical protein
VRLGTAWAETGRIGSLAAVLSLWPSEKAKKPVETPKEPLGGII